MCHSRCEAFKLNWLQSNFRTCKLIDIFTSNYVFDDLIPNLNRPSDGRSDLNFFVLRKLESIFSPFNFLTLIS